MMTKEAYELVNFSFLLMWKYKDATAIHERHIRFEISNKIYMLIFTHPYSTVRVLPK